jgi:hypothetical protein
MNGQSFGTTRVPVLGIPLGSPEEKWHLDVVLAERHIIYYREGNGASSQRLWSMWRLCLRLFLLSPPHYFHSICINHLFSWLCRLISSWIFACEFILILILELQHILLTLEVLWVKERTPTYFSFNVFIFEFASKSFKEFGGASSIPKFHWSCTHQHTMSSSNVN